MSAPLRIGLSGPIGCGKSTVARMLAELGAEAIDADAIARQVTEPGAPALDEIRARFGAGVFAGDGSLDREALAAIVFSDPVALADLERLTHPRVREVVERRLAAAAQAATPVVVVEAIKLVEGELAARCDEVWLIDCSPTTQRARLTGRGMAQPDIDRRLAAQGEGLSSRLAAALEGGVPYRVLATDGPLEETRARVADALAEALRRHGRTRASRLTD